MVELDYFDEIILKALVRKNRRHSITSLKSDSTVRNLSNFRVRKILTGLTKLEFVEVAGVDSWKITPLGIKIQEAIEKF